MPSFPNMSQVSFYPWTIILEILCHRTGLFGQLVQYKFSAGIKRQFNCYTYDSDKWKWQAISFPPTPSKVLTCCNESDYIICSLCKRVSRDRSPLIIMYPSCVIVDTCCKSPTWGGGVHVFRNSSRPDCNPIGRLLWF